MFMLGSSSLPMVNFINSWVLVLNSHSSYVVSPIRIALVLQRTPDYSHVMKLISILTFVRGLQYPILQLCGVWS
jgi:hypothetical protein